MEYYYTSNRYYSPDEVLEKEQEEDSKRNWNNVSLPFSRLTVKEYQVAIDVVHEDTSLTDESKQSSVDTLNKIQGEFLSVANETAKLIIDEMTSLNKTINPINIGGVAGITWSDSTS